MPSGPVIPAVATATALSLLGDQMLYAVLPSRPEAAGIGLAALGIMLSVHRFIRLGANSIGGLLYDRFGRRPPFLLGMTFAVLATSGYLLSWGFWPLLVSRLVWGLAYALIAVGGLAIVMDVTEPRDRGRTVGVFQAMVGVGTLVGLLLSGVLTDLIGYRGTLALYAPLTAVGWLIAFLAVRETAPRRGGAATVPLLVTLRALDRRLLAPGLVSFANFFTTHGVIAATLGVFLKERMAAAGGVALPVATLTGALLATRRLLTLVASPLAGALADRTGSRRLVAAAGALASIAGFVVLMTGPGVGGIVVGVVLTSLGEGVLHPPLAAWVGDAAPPAVRGVVMGGFATVNDLGGATGPLVGYALAAVFGLAWVYALCALLMASTLAVLAAAGDRARPAP